MFNPYNFAYYNLIHGFSVSGNVNEAFILRDETMRSGFAPNVVAYNALMNGLRKSRNLGRAWRFFDKLAM